MTMKLINRIYDNRIKALNCLIEIDLEEYYNLSSDILRHNQFQRRRVKSSSTVYSLLKKDILGGCVIPPIVLAHSKIEDIKNLSNKKDEEIVTVLEKNIDKLVILDGLQRTYTIKDLYEELLEKNDKASLLKIKNQKLRIEIYLGIDKIGILYRMLTLNTGQTPMSIRHQIEILYSDYIAYPIDGITFITETDEKPIKNINEYNFKDIVEGFNSYLDRDYLTIDRFDILHNIKSLEKLSKENQSADLFNDYVKTYHQLSLYINDKLLDWKYDIDADRENSINNQPFIKSIDKLFSKSQVMTGFGSAIGKLIDLKLLSSIIDVSDLIKDIVIEDSDIFMDKLIYNLDIIRKDAKKIGNDQRMYFHFIFREIFDRKGDAYLNFGKAIDEAFVSYQRKTQ